MSAPITLDMLRSASSEDFPVIDLGGYMQRRGRGARPTSPSSFGMRSKTSGF